MAAYLVDMQIEVAIYHITLATDGDMNLLSFSMLPIE
jgi:hypothetical protein